MYTVWIFVHVCTFNWFYPNLLFAMVSFSVAISCCLIVANNVKQLHVRLTVDLFLVKDPVATGTLQAEKEDDIFAKEGMNKTVSIKTKYDFAGEEVEWVHGGMYIIISCMQRVMHNFVAESKIKLMLVVSQWHVHMWIEWAIIMYMVGSTLYRGLLSPLLERVLNELCLPSMIEYIQSHTHCCGCLNMVRPDRLPK